MKKRIPFIVFMVSICILAYTHYLYRENESFNKILNNEMDFFKENRVRADRKARFVNAYRLKDIDITKARKEFEELAGENTPLKPYALYNIGTILIGEGIEKKSRVLFEQGIGYYKEALRAMPRMQEAKYNLELALKMLESSRMFKAKEEPTSSGEPGYFPNIDTDI